MKQSYIEVQSGVKGQIGVSVCARAGIQRSQKGQRDHHTEITISSSSWLVPSSVIHMLVALLSGRSSQLSISIAQSLDSHPPTSLAHTLKADVLTNILPSQHFHVLELYSLSP